MVDGKNLLGINNLKGQQVALLPHQPPKLQPLEERLRVTNRLAFKGFLHFFTTPHSHLNQTCQ